MGDERMVLTREQEQKLDDVLRFFRRIEAAFAPPAPEPLDAAEAERQRKEVEKALEAEIGAGPSGEDLLMWSVPGPLPSEIREAEITITTEDT